MQLNKSFLKLMAFNLWRGFFNPSDGLAPIQALQVVVKKNCLFVKAI
jgi:hypothetical protein